MTSPPTTPNVKSYFITGCHGYIGRQLIRFLLKTDNARIFGLDQKSGASLGISSTNAVPKDWQAFQGDLRHPNLPKLLSEIQPDVIFHTAAAPKKAPLEEQLQQTVMGTEHLLNSLVETHVEARVVVLGSAAEYGLRPEPVDETALLLPESAYGIAKAAQSHVAMLYARKYDLPVMVGRIFNVYGATQNTLSVGSFASQIVRQERLGITLPRIKTENLAAWRDLIHIEDVVKALFVMAQKGRSGEVYNIASGQAVQLQTVLDKLVALSHLKSVEPSFRGLQDENRSEAVIDKIREETGWRPWVSLEDGLSRELAYWREQAEAVAV